MPRTLSYLALAVVPFLILNAKAQTAGTIGNNITGGTCPSGQYVNTMSGAGVLGCATPSGTGGGGTGTTGFTDAGNSFTSATITSCTSSNGIQISQNIAVASSLTVPSSCVLRFVPDGELLPASGTTLTINGSIQAPQLQRIFGGSGAIAGLTGDIPAEWFGVVGDGTTDNTVTMQAALNSLKAGHVKLGPFTYKTTAALTVSKPSTGIIGTTVGEDYPSGNPGSVIALASASADCLTITGTWDEFRQFTCQRTIAPSSTAKGLDMVNVGGLTVDQVDSNDSAYTYYSNGTPEYGLGHFTNDSFGWGLGGFSYGSGTSAVGFFMDSSNGTAENSILLNNVGGNGQNGPSQVVCFQISGTAINDVDASNISCAQAAIGLNVSYSTGSLSYGAQDIHIRNPIFDGMSIYPVQIANLPANRVASLTIQDGWLNGGYAGVSVTNSDGVVLQNLQISGTGDGVYVGSGSAHVSVLGNLFMNSGSHGISVSNSSLLTVGNNIFRPGSGASTLADIYGVGFTNSSIVGNILGGQATYGVDLDSASTGLSCAANVSDPATVTTAINDAAGACSTQPATVSGNSSTPATATPTASPAAGTYSSTQSVTLSDSTSGAVIHYTTDGTTPTSSSTTYGSPISVASSETIKALAVASGYANSAVGIFAYTIGTPTAATPTFSPAGGSYGSAQTVTISDATSGAAIHYTTDGSTPTASSTTYSTPITTANTGSTTINALAVASGYNNSAVGTATYTIATYSTYTDTFPSSYGTALNSANWTTYDNAPVQTGSGHVYGANGAGGAYFSGGTFSNNQYAQAVYQGSGGQVVYLGVRIQTSAHVGYFWDVYNHTITINGTSTGLSCPVPSAGDVIRVSVTGNVVTCIDETTSGSASYTDTANTYTTGYPGFYVAATTELDGPFTAGSN